MFTYGMDAQYDRVKRTRISSARWKHRCRSFALAQLIAKQGYKKVAIIAQITPSVRSSGGFQKEDRGNQPSTKIWLSSITRREPRITPLCQSDHCCNPDVIFTPNWGNDLTLLLKQGVLWE